MCENQNKFMHVQKTIERKVKEIIKSSNAKKEGKFAFFMYINNHIPNAGRLTLTQAKRCAEYTKSIRARMGSFTSSMEKWKVSESPIRISDLLSFYYFSNNLIRISEYFAERDLRWLSAYNIGLYALILVLR